MSIKPLSFHCGFKSSHNIMGVDVVDGQQHLEQQMLRNANFQKGSYENEKDHTSSITKQEGGERTQYLKGRMPDR